jgi:hypothetical protein
LPSTTFSMSRKPTSRTSVTALFATTALERHWDITLTIEVISESRYDTGRINVQDYMTTKYARLDAEQRLVEARARRAKK